MSTTNTRELSLIRDGANVKVKVSYRAEFNPLERHLAALGLTFIERISVIGVDPPGSTTGTVLAEFPGKFISVPDGTGTFSTLRKREITLSRTALDEDANPLLGPDVDADEIRCRIRIQAFGLPPAITPDAFTDQEILSGVLAPASTAAKA
jgi:hypothetical protein